MEFTQQTFLGASIMNFSTELGWNQQSSSLSVNVVEDPDNVDAQGNPKPDVFTPALPGNENFIGCPVYFEYDGWKFGGLLQSWVKENNTGGYPVYRITVVDPREVLDGIYVVLNNFQLQGQDAAYYKEEMPNLFNVFDFWETDPIAVQFGGGSFGGSSVNDNGMLWSLVRDGYIHLQNAYGPARSQGVSLLVDFAGLPTPPLDYRISGDGRTLSEIISELCEDSGVDYFCYLEYVPTEVPTRQHQIKFKTVSRTKQPPLGQIKVYVEDKLNKPDDDKTVSEYTTGLEFRNDYVSTLVLGGNREDLYIVEGLNTGYNIFAGNLLEIATPPTNFDNSKIRPFWGYDINGKAITTPDLNDETPVTLNCAEIANIVGATTLTCTIFEIRAALTNFESWQFAVNLYNTTLAQQLGYDSSVFAEHYSNILEVLQQDSFHGTELTPTQLKNMKLAALHAAGENRYQIQIQSLYNFVKKVATEYYGRKFVVLLNNVKWKIVPDTLEVVYEYEISDTGWVPPDYGDMNAKTGLSIVNQDVFTDEVGKFYGFCRFDNVIDKDLSEINPDEAVLQDDGNTLFVKVDIDKNLVNPIQNPIETIFNNSPGRSSAAAIMTVPLVRNIPPVPVDNILAMFSKFIKELSQDSKEKVKKNLANKFTAPVIYSMEPTAVAPSVAVIPIKSNVYSYGPWKTTGFSKGGKVRFEKDDNLVPWNYGTYDKLNYAAEAKILNAVTRMTVGERGSITEAGTPKIPLGDVLKAGGPIVTSINVSVGNNGVKTTYNMQTYTPKFGAFAWSNAERLRTLNQSTSLIRNKRRVRAQSITRKALDIQKQTFLANLPYYARREGGTPHEVMTAYVTEKNEDSKQTNVATEIAQHCVSKVVGNTAKGSAEEESKKVGLVGMEALFRPYQTNFEAETKYLPKFTKPTVSGVGNPSVLELNPFQDNHDISFVFQAEDGTYKDYVNRDNAKDNLQPVGIKTPIVAVGWGYDTAGNPVPSSAPGQFLQDYQRKPETWKAGPIDLRWDEERGVWSTGSALRLCELDDLVYSNRAVFATVLKPTQFINQFDRTENKITVTVGYPGVILSSGTKCWVTPFGRLNYIVGAGP